ncbi:MAG: thioredoxin family protein [Melioribacter sp.]|uniref:TlpA family protein disulfide reductase n=1 Tax=Rosettibacter primus TaxID=3111523 RepID=UPI00247C91E9|nr:thioredoxin family protein [Melioribacter sp.]
MKKKFINLFVICFFMVVLITAIIFGTREEILPIGAKLTEIKYIWLGDTLSIKVDAKPIMIMYFSPDCSHCEYDLMEINKRVNELKNVDVYLLTTDNKFVNKKLYEKYNNIMKMSNIKFGIVNKEEYKAKFGITVTPVFYFFNIHGKLVDKLIGEIKFSRLLESIWKSDDAQRQISGSN